MTVGEWLDTWIAGRKIRASTIKCYKLDIRLHLKPRIGHIWLGRLRVADLTEMFNAIVERNVEIEECNALRRAAVDELKTIRGREPRRVARAALAEMTPFRRVTGARTRLHIRSTLRAALNDAITQELITFNPAAHVELDPVRRPKALVWTMERITRFAETGERPSPMMVSTPAQTGAFLDYITKDELYALFLLVALRGLRGGKHAACAGKTSTCEGAHSRSPFSLSTMTARWRSRIRRVMRETARSPWTRRRSLSSVVTGFDSRRRN